MSQTPPQAESLAELRARIEAWRKAAPAAGIRLLPKVNVPALGVVRRALPENTAVRALAAAYSAALRIAPMAPVVKAAGCQDFAELAQLPLAQSARLAKRYSRRQQWLAGGTGAAMGLAGAAGLVADAPALLVFSLAAAIRIGQCYGELVSPSLAAALFALASADTMEEKDAAWNAALAASTERLRAHMDDAALRDGLERAAEREFAKAALAGSLQKLGVTLVTRTGAKKLAAALPFVGAVAGGAVNARFIGQIAEAAEMVFSARRLGRKKGGKRATLAVAGGNT